MAYDWFRCIIIKNPGTDIVCRGFLFHHMKNTLLKISVGFKKTADILADDG